MLAGRARSLAQNPAEFKAHELRLCRGVSPDGATLATASFDSTVKLWDYKTGKGKDHAQGAHRPGLFRRVSPDGNLIATGSAGQTIRVYDKEGKFLKELKGHGDVVDSPRQPDSKSLARLGTRRSI
jgi:WD40 repeat protein